MAGKWRNRPSEQRQSYTISNTKEIVHAPLAGL